MTERVPPPAPNILTSMPSATELAARISKRQETWFETWMKKNAGPPNNKIFHYTDSAGLLGILQSRVFWAADITHLNDSTELKHGIELVRRQLDAAARRRAQGKVAGLLAAVRENFHSFGFLTAYVACFCEQGDLLSQWRGYGASGGGYAIGISPCGMRETHAAEPKIVLRKVIYEPTEQLELINDSVAQLEEFADYAFSNGVLDWNEVGKQLTSFFRQEIGDYLWCFKNQAFSEEREWRFMYLTGPANPDTRPIRFRTTSSGLVPYVELDIFSLRNGEMSYLDVCEIVCGPTLDPERSARTVQTLLSSLKYEGAKVEPSRVPLRRT